MGAGEGVRAIDGRPADWESQPHSAGDDLGTVIEAPRRVACGCLAGLSRPLCAVLLVPGAASFSSRHGSSAQLMLSKL